jgi:hypothetical protein
MKKKCKINKNGEWKMEDNLKVCEYCLQAIMSREGNLPTLIHYYDDDEQGICEWCEDYFYKLYELI